MLVGWILASSVSVLLRDRLVLSPLGRSFVAFWAGSFVLLLAGWLVALLTGHAAELAARDFVAFSLAAIVVLLLSMKPGGLDEIRAAGPVAITVATVGLAFLLLVTFPLGTFGLLDPWHGPRFKGWSENPNQVALVMSAVPFLVLHRFRRTRGLRARAAHLLLLAAAVAVGIASLSDALQLAWVTGTVLMMAHAWLLGVFRGRSTFAGGVAAYVVAPVLAVGLLLIGGHAAYLRVTGTLDAIYERGGQGSERLTLWRNGLRAMAESPLVGLGPGPHSGSSGPFGNFEAHNSFIDWGTATGLPGVLLLVGLLLWVARRAAREPALLAGLAALMVVSVSGFNLRHPVFWLYVLFVATAGQAKGGSTGRQGQRPQTPGTSPVPAPSGEAGS